MASFTEQAVLTVKDQSTGPIRKINAELRKLFATARSLKSIKIDLTANDKGLVKASAAIKRLTADLRGLQGGARAVNIRVNTGGISQAQRQIAALRASARSPIQLATRAGAAPPRQPPGARGGGLFGGGVGVPARFGVHVLGGVINLTASSMAGIAHAIGQSAKEGYRQVDIADTKMDLRRLTDEQRKGVDQAIAAVKEQQEGPKSAGMLFNPAELKNLAAEAIGITGSDPKAVEHLLQQAVTLAKIGVGQGQTKEQARTGMIDFIKAAEQSGKMTYRENVTDAAGNVIAKAGDYNAQAAETYFNTLRKLARSIGEEFTGQKWRTTIGSTGVSKYGLDERGTILLGHAMEELGSKAGVGLNEMLKNLTGARLEKGKMRRLSDWGLLDLEQAATGKVGNKTFSQVIAKDAKDEEELRADQLAWIAGKLIPKMVEKGFNPANVKDAQKVAGMITSGKGTDALAGIIVRLSGLERDVRQTMALPGSAQAAEEDLSKTGIIKALAVKAAIQNLLGETIQAVEPILLPGMQATTKVIGGMADNVRKGEYGAAIAKFTAGMAAMSPAALAAYKLDQLVSRATTQPMGRAAATAAIMDERTRPLGFAAKALLDAAAALSQAASDQIGVVPLMRAAVAALAGYQFLSGAGGEGASGVIDRMGGIPKVELDAWRNADDTERQRLENVWATRGAMRKVTQDLAKAEQDLADQRFKAEQEPTTFGARFGDEIRKAEQRITELKAAVEKYKVEMSRLEGEKPKLPTIEAPTVTPTKPVITPTPAGFPKDAVQKTVDSIVAAAAKKAAAEAAAAKKKEDADQRKRFPKGVPVPRERPKETPAEPEPLRIRVTPGGLTEIEPPKGEPPWLAAYKATVKETPAGVTALQTAMTDANAAATKLAGSDVLGGLRKLASDLSDWQLGNLKAVADAITRAADQSAKAGERLTTSGDSFAARFDALPTQLATAGNTFATTFAPIPGQLTAAGQSAADIIAAGAASAGAVYGNTAAALIAAAAANVNINVNTLEGGKKTDTGSASP